MVNIANSSDRLAGYFFVCSRCCNYEHEVPQRCHRCGAEVSSWSDMALEQRREIKKALVLEEGNLRMLLKKSKTITQDEKLELDTMLQQNAAAQMALESEYE